MRKHLTHLAAALAVTLLLGAAASPLRAAAATPELPAVVAELDAENTTEAAAESRLSQSYLDMTIEYNDPHPVRQLYLSSVADGDMVYQWYSTNPAVATVDRNGIVTAQKPGRATIVADTYTKTLRCEVEVTSNIGKVTLNADELLLESIGGAAPLKATVAVENGSAVPITWLTADPRVATVDSFGVVTAVGDGKTVITAVTPRRAQRFLPGLLRHAGGRPAADQGQRDQACPWHPRRLCRSGRCAGAGDLRRLSRNRNKNKSRHAPGKAGAACLLCFYHCSTEEN